VIAALRALDNAGAPPRFDRRLPRRPVSIFLASIASLLLLIEIPEIVGFLRSGVVPESVRRAGDATFFPYVLDLGVIVPLAVAGAVGVWRESAWGGVLAAILLVKTATMGAALLAMNWLTARAGLPPDGLTPFYALLTAGGLGFGAWFFRYSD
jgi:hypothetical protein